MVLTKNKIQSLFFMKKTIIPIRIFAPNISSLCDSTPADINGSGLILLIQYFISKISISKIRTPIPTNNFVSDFVILKLLATFSITAVTGLNLKFFG